MDNGNNKATNNDDGGKKFTSWLDLFSSILTSKDSFKRLFVFYFLIWNYDFILLLIGKQHILQNIALYYGFNSRDNFGIALLGFFQFYCGKHWGYFLYIIINRVIMPCILVYISRFCISIARKLYMEIEEIPWIKNNTINYRKHEYEKNNPINNENKGMEIMRHREERMRESRMETMNYRKHEDGEERDEGEI